MHVVCAARWGAMSTTRIRQCFRVAERLREAKSKPSAPLIPLRTSHAALLTVAFCAWTSNAPGGDGDLTADPWETPLSAEALESTSQTGTPNTALATTPPPPPTAIANPPIAPAVTPAATATLAAPTVSISTDGRERSLVLAIPVHAERIAPEQAPLSVIYTSGPLQNLGPFEFGAAADAEIPEPVVAFEPAAARFDEASVVALSAVDQVVRDGFAASYPAKLEDIVLPAKLDVAPSFTRGSTPAGQSEHLVWAPAIAEPRMAIQFAEALPIPLEQITQPTVASPTNTSTMSAAVTPQQLARLDVADRLPGPPLAAAALAQVSAFDASRTVQRFEVTGKTALARPLIDDALKAFLGVERTDEQLQAARTALQRAHDVNGQRVKVVLGEKREHDGVARLDVRELKRYSLRIAGELRYDPVTRRNVRADVLIEHDEPLPSLTLSRKLSLK